MSVETHRRQFASNIQSDISRLEKSIARDEDVLKNIKNLNLSQDILKIKQQELQDNISRKKDDIEKLKLTGNEVLSGNKDSEIIKKNVAVKKVEKSKVKIKAKPFVKNNYNPKQYVSEREYEYQYNHLMRVVETMPDYMKRNLEEMPSNKGYIWRGCWFFGKLREHKGENTVVFEKGRNTMKIHEFDNHNYRVFEKYGQDRKILLSSRPRKQFFKSLV